jgi:hypothetical protein
MVFILRVRRMTGPSDFFFILSCIFPYVFCNAYFFLEMLKLENNVKSQTCWCTPVIPALRRLRQEDCKFEASLGKTLS